MAVYYVYSGAGGSNNGSSWANAFTTLTAAFVTEVAGDTLYVAHDHAESTAADITLTSSGTAANPTKVICVDRAGSVPPVSADRRATATVTITGSNRTINIASYTHYDGIIFVSGTSGIGAIVCVTTGSVWQRFDNCSFRLGPGTTSGSISLGNATVGGTRVDLNNCTFSFTATSQQIFTTGRVTWRNTPSALLGTAVPTTVMGFVNARGASLECIGIDFSAAGSGKTICDTQISQGAAARFLDCKLNASVTKSAVPSTYGAVDVDFIRTGSSGVNYTIHRHRVSGLLVEETTIVRTGGASDGTTPIAWKIDTTATCTYLMPFECPPIAIWNDTTGSARTATVEGVWGGGAVPNDDDIWLEVEYLGDASSPQGSFVNDGKADLLATAAGQTSSSETWGGSTTKFKLNVSFTAQQKGWIYARVKCAKASSTFYVDPLVTLA